MIIDHIITDIFSIGCFGRSGSRSIADFLTGFYSDYIDSSKKWRYLFDVENLDEDEFNTVLRSFAADKHLQKIIAEGFFTHHLHSFQNIDEFNNTEKKIKILVLRDPIERAKSGSRVAYSPNFHGAPVLHKVDFESVDYIIDFNKLSYYTPNTHRGAFDPDLRPNSKFRKELDKQSNQKLNETLLNAITPWETEEYSYDEEIEIYNNAIKTKTELPIDVWKKLVRNYYTVNIPTRMFGKRYRK